MATPAELLAQSLAKFKTANRIDGTKNSYRKDNPAEYAAVMAYLNGGARPNATSDMGMGLVLEEDARRALAVTPPPPPPPPGLGVDRATMLATGGTILREDTAVAVDPRPGLWGDVQYQMQDISRHTHHTTGGDTRPRADGSQQGNTSYRQLTVIDGDALNGERCQLGRNGWQNGENSGAQTNGTFKLAHEGDRFITFWSMRFPAGFPMNVNDWQQLLQWKQAQPYSDANCATKNPDGNGVVQEIQLWNGSLRLMTWWKNRWVTAVPVTDRWIRFAWDITFSQEPAIGKSQLFVDLDGDGDFLDANEASPVWNGATMLYAVNAHSGLSAGQSVPCYLSLGIYHSDIYGTTTLDVDNVQVMG